MTTKRNCLQSSLYCQWIAWKVICHDLIWLQDISSSQSMHFCKNFIQYLALYHTIETTNSKIIGWQGNKSSWSAQETPPGFFNYSLSPLVATVGCGSCPNKSSSSSSSFLDIVVGRAGAKHEKSEIYVKQLCKSQTERKGSLFEADQENWLLTFWLVVITMQVKKMQKKKTTKKTKKQTIKKAPCLFYAGFTNSLSMCSWLDFLTRLGLEATSKMVDTNELLVGTFCSLEVTDAVVCVPVVPTNWIPFTITTVHRASTTDYIRDIIASLSVAACMATTVIW